VIGYHWFSNSLVSGLLHILKNYVGLWRSSGYCGFYLLIYIDLKLKQSLKICINLFKNKNNELFTWIRFFIVDNYIFQHKKIVRGKKGLLKFMHIFSNGFLNKRQLDSYICFYFHLLRYHLPCCLWKTQVCNCEGMK